MTKKELERLIRLLKIEVENRNWQEQPIIPTTEIIKKIHYIK